MPFCHIYVRRDGTYRVRMHGTITRPDQYGFSGGTVEYISKPFESEERARWWVSEGRKRDGLDDMPEPRIICRVADSAGAPVMLAGQVHPPERGCGVVTQVEVVRLAAPKAAFDDKDGQG